MTHANEPSRQWLDWLVPRTREALLAHGVPKEYAAGAMLMKQGETPTSAMIIEDGLVAVNRMGDDGHPVFLAFRGPHELLGEIGVLDRRPRVADVVALRAPVHVRWYDADGFREFLGGHRDAQRAAERAMLRKHLVHQERRTRYGRGRPTRRVAHVLVDFLADFGTIDDEGRAVIDAPLNQQRIADLTGLGTDAVWAAVRRLKVDGMISLSAGPASRIRVEDQAALLAATLA